MKTLFLALLLAASFTVTAQERTHCKGTTTKNKPCQILIVDSLGYCRLHTPSAIRCNFMKADSIRCWVVVKEAGKRCYYHSGK